MLELQNIKISNFSTVIPRLDFSNMTNLLLFEVLIQFHFTRRDEHPALCPKNVVPKIFNLVKNFSGKLKSQL